MNEYTRVIRSEAVALANLLPGKPCELNLTESRLKLMRTHLHNIRVFSERIDEAVRNFATTISPPLLPDLED